MVKERDRERTQRVTKEVTRRGQKEGRIGGGTYVCGAQMMKIRNVH